MLTKYPCVNIRMYLCEHNSISIVSVSIRCVWCVHSSACCLTHSTLGVFKLGERIEVKRAVLLFIDRNMRKHIFHRMERQSKAQHTTHYSNGATVVAATAAAANRNKTKGKLTREFIHSIPNVCVSTSFKQHISRT